MPHGNCFFWRPDVLWLHVISDSLIAAAYYSIPATLYVFVRKRGTTQIRALVLMFAGFILTCGTTHLLAVWNIWHSAYRLEGVVKALTAGLSLVTAVAAVRFTPAALRLIPPQEMEASNRALLQENAARTKAEEQVRRMIESERLASEAKIRAYFEAAPEAVLVVARDGTIELVNRATEEMFGYTRAELLNSQVETLIPVGSRDLHAVHRFQFFYEPRVRPMSARKELAARRKDGTVFPVEIGLSYVESEDGVLAMALVSDITERKRAEAELARKAAALRASEAQLRSYLEAASQAILAVSGDGRITLVNRSTEEMFGYRREELLGRELEILLPERYRGVHVGHHAAFYAEPRRRPMGPGSELWGRRKDGTEFPVEVGLSYVETGDGALALGLISDITERKRAADELASANEQLRESNAELEQFAYLASHDLQEPLRMITGYLSLLERRCGANLDEDGKEFIHYAIDGSERMKRLIRDFLAVSRIGRQSLNVEQAPADKMVASALGNLHAAIEESGAEIHAGPLPVIPADAGLLTQVFQNLIANAIKFRGEAAPVVHISAERGAKETGAEWIFRIRDNGIGIEPRHADRIFRLFERLHEPEKYAGSGIGLAVCKKIVERHGGRIWLESEPGVGATSCFTIPAKTEMESRTAQAP